MSDNDRGCGDYEPHGEHMWSGMDGGEWMCRGVRPADPYAVSRRALAVRRAEEATERAEKEREKREREEASWEARVRTVARWTDRSPFWQWFAGVTWEPVAASEGERDNTPRGKEPEHKADQWHRVVVQPKMDLPDGEPPLYVRVNSYVHSGETNLDIVRPPIHNVDIRDARKWERVRAISSPADIGDWLEDETRASVPADA